MRRNGQVALWLDGDFGCIHGSLDIRKRVVGRAGSAGDCVMVIVTQRMNGQIYACVCLTSNNMTRSYD